MYKITEKSRAKSSQTTCERLASSVVDSWGLRMLALGSALGRGERGGVTGEWGLRGA